MRFTPNIHKRFRYSIETAMSTILEVGLEEHKVVARSILASNLEIRVQPAARIGGASGITTLIDARRTRRLIASGPLGLIEALGEIYIAIAEETIDTGGQRGCEGTLVHEGRHAYDFARMVESFSNAEVNPLSIFDPSLYELELAAHQTAGRYMLQVNKPDYLDEGASSRYCATPTEPARSTTTGSRQG